MQNHIAIEVDSPETWDMLCALNSHFEELDPDFNQGHFVIVTSPDPKLRAAIVSPETVGSYFDHLEPAPEVKFKFVRIVGKE